MRPLIITSGLIGAALIFGACASAKSAITPLTLCSSISISGSSFVCNVASVATAEPVAPTQKPVQPTSRPTVAPTSSPTSKPVVAPTLAPVQPTESPQPTSTPTDEPRPIITLAPTVAPTLEPVAAPTAVASDTPTQEPTLEPSEPPTTAPDAPPVSVEPIPKRFIVGQAQSFKITQAGFVAGFSASSSDESVARVSVIGSTLTVVPVAAGSAVITVFWKRRTQLDEYRK